MTTRIAVIATGIAAMIAIRTATIPMRIGTGDIDVQSNGDDRQGGQQQSFHLTPKISPPKPRGRMIMANEDGESMTPCV